MTDYGVYFLAVQAHWCVAHRPVRLSHGFDAGGRGPPVCPSLRSQSGGIYQDGLSLHNKPVFKPPSLAHTHALSYCATEVWTSRSMFKVSEEDIRPDIITQAVATLWFCRHRILSLPLILPPHRRKKKSFKVLLRSYFLLLFYLAKQIS